MHLRIPADIEKELDVVQHMVVDAAPCQVNNPHASLTKDDVQETFLVQQEVDIMCTLPIIGAVMEVSGKMPGIHTVHVVRMEDLEDGHVVGDSYKVPGKKDPSVSELAIGNFPSGHQLYPSVYASAVPIPTLQFSGMLENAAMKTNPSVLDIFNCSSTIQYLALAENTDYSTSQQKHPCVSLDLTQFYLLQYRFEGVLHGQPTMKTFEFYESHTPSSESFSPPRGMCCLCTAILRCFINLGYLLSEVIFCASEDAQKTSWPGCYKASAASDQTSQKQCV